MYRLLHALEQSLEFSRIEIIVVRHGHHAAQSRHRRQPRFLSWIRSTPGQSHIRGCFPRRPTGRSPTRVRLIGRFHPAIEILLGHPGIVGDQPGQIHGVVIPGVIEIERELIVFLDPLLDLLHVADLHAEERFFHAVVAKHFLDAFRPSFFSSSTISFALINNSPGESRMLASLKRSRRRGNRPARAADSAAPRRRRPRSTMIVPPNSVTRNTIFSSRRGSGTARGLSTNRANGYPEMPQAHPDYSITATPRCRPVKLIDAMIT